MSQDGQGRRRLRFLLSRRLTESQRQILAQANEVSFFPMEAIGDDGILNHFAVRHVDDVRSGFTMFFDGDVVVAKITPCFENGKGAVVSGTCSGIGFGTTELHVLSPTPILHSRFLYYVTMSDEFRRRGEAEMKGAAGQKRLTEEYILNFRLDLPAFEQQGEIAQFLDTELGQLDELVAAKQQLLGILAEKRQALISHAVIRGIDPDAPLRDSGIPWLGQIPEHWNIRKVAYLYKERDERGQPDLPLLLVSINSGVTLREFADDRIEQVASDFGTYKVARKNDVAFNKMRMWQGAVGVVPTDGLVSPDYVVAKPTAEIVPAYYGQLFATPAFSAESARNSHGIVWDRLRLYWDGFRDIKVPYPPLDEQSAIVTHIARETAKLDALRTATEESIALLKERRSALISAAVTGKLRVAAKSEVAEILSTAL